MPQNLSSKAAGPGTDAPERENRYSDGGTRALSQPVIDTLQVADALRRTGMEQGQAEGLARALGAELGEHVAVRRELDTGFDGMRAQMDARFQQVDARFQQVDARFQRVEARLDALAGQFRFGLGLVVALFAAVVGVIGVLHANALVPQPMSQTMPQPAPQPIALYLPPGTSVTVPDVRMPARSAFVDPGTDATP